MLALRKRFASLTVSLPALGLALLLSGCGVTLTNLTPQSIPQNPSNIYTFSFVARDLPANTVDESLEAFITIGGETFPMDPSPIGARAFDFDYPLPPDKTEAKFYFTLRYDTRKDRQTTERELVSELHTAQLVNRYVIQLLSVRGPVGATVRIVGRGFAEGDQVYFGGQATATTFASETTLSFVVPPVPAEETYTVAVNTSGGMLNVGGFQVDPATLQLSPARLELTSGQSTELTIELPFPAPADGLPVEILTDIPTSLIIPEVVIPAGVTAFSVPVEAAAPAEGVLVARANGFREAEISVTVR